MDANNVSGEFWNPEFSEGFQAEVGAAVMAREPGALSHLQIA